MQRRRRRTEIRGEKQREKGNVEERKRVLDEYPLKNSNYYKNPEGNNSIRNR